MDRDYSDFLCSLNMEDAIDTELLSEILEKAINLADSMKKLRDLYKASGKLPLAPYHDDYENMQYICELIENEANKFGSPCVIEKKYIQLSKSEINKLKNNPFALGASGFGDWVEEGLF